MITKNKTQNKVRGGKWATRDLFALDADVTVYWPDVRPCYEEQAQ